MGACEIRQASHFYKRIPRESENEFWVNKIQLHYFGQVIAKIKKSYDDDFKLKQVEAKAKIQAKLNAVKRLFLEEIDACGKARLSEKVEQLNEELQDVQKEFYQLQMETVAALEEVKDQKNSHFIKFYTKIQARLKHKQRQVPLSVYLCQQTVQEIYQTWKMTHQREIKQAKEALDKEFSQRDEQLDYYKMRFASAIDQERLEDLAQRQPFQRQIEQQEAQRNPFTCNLFSF